MNHLDIIKSIRMQNKNEILNDLKTYIDNLENENKELIQRLKNYNKDTEIQRLKNKIKHIKAHSIKIMTKKERENLKRFNEWHYKNCKSSTEIIFTPTGIGTGIQVKCKKCKEIKDITDVDSW